ncbi:MAG: hypothetical protein LBE35_01380 [Clostridiales bacterium]|nr:hypothetical protein [Clostridiales bacterium]
MPYDIVASLQIDGRDGHISRGEGRSALRIHNPGWEAELFRILDMAR